MVAICHGFMSIINQGVGIICLQVVLKQHFIQLPEQRVPQVTLGNVKHSNGKSFSSWNTISIMYGGEWNGGFGRENTESVEYSAETGTTGDLLFFLSCQGAIPGIVPGSVSLALKTG